MRKFITKEELKDKLLVNKVILPFILILGVIGVILGNRDTFLMTVLMVVVIIVFLTYTKSVNKKEKKKNKKVRKILGIILMILWLFVLYDTVRYTVAMGQVQYHNKGYVTGDVRSGGFKGNMYVTEEKEGETYIHVFEGWKYLSKVKEVKEE